MTQPQRRYPHNVDICVTCVSEKPPKLPLREELPSLGIEVVYNAQGVGAKASKHESKKLVKEFREKEQVQDLKSSRFFPQSPKKVKEKQQERKRQESKLKIPKALSYQNYEKRLLQKGSTDSSSSVSSWGSHSTNDSSGSKGKQQTKKLKGWAKFRSKFPLSPKKAARKNDSGIPPATVEFAKPEENALKEAYSAFANAPELALLSTASKETQKTSSKSKSQTSSFKASTPSEEPSSKLDPSTLSTKQEDFSFPKVELVAAPSTQTQLPGLLGFSGASSSGVSSSAEPSTTESSAEPSTTGSSAGPSTEASSTGPSATESSDNHSKSKGTEEKVSEPGTSDVYTSSLSSKKVTTTQNQVRFHSSPNTQEALPNLPLDTSFSTKGNSSTSTEKDKQVQSTKAGKSPLKEFFDLTALSEEDITALADEASVDKDLSTLSSKKEGDAGGKGVQVYSSQSIQQQLPGLPGISESHHKHAHNESETKQQGFTRYGDTSDQETSQSNEFDGVPLLSPSSSSSPTAGSNEVAQSSQESEEMTDIFQDVPAEDSLKLVPPKQGKKEDDQSTDEGANVSKYDSSEESDRSDERKVQQTSFRFSRISPLRAAQGDPLNHNEERLHKVSFSQDVEERYYEKEMVNQLRKDTSNRINSLNHLSDDIDPVEKFYEDTSPKSESSGNARINFDKGDRDAALDAALDALAEEAFQNTLQASGISHDFGMDKSTEGSGGEYSTPDGFEIEKFDDGFEIKRFDSGSDEGDNPIEEAAFKPSSAQADEVNDHYEELSNEEDRFAHTQSRYNDRVSIPLFRNESETKFHDALVMQHRLTSPIDPVGRQGTLRPIRQDPPAYNDDTRQEIEQEGDSSSDSQHPSHDSSESEETPSKSESSDEEVQNKVKASLTMGKEKPVGVGNRLLAALAKGDVAPDEIARTRLTDGRRFPLHVACDREFPDRFKKSKGSITDELVNDVICHKRLIEVIASKNMEACTEPDAAGDLPVHLLARRLMEWEAQWYQKVYERAKEEHRVDGGNAGISKLYQTMSEAIDVLLRPVVKSRGLCQLTGSIGRLLPLHIAAIFTVSYETLRLTLEGYPEAASVTCDLRDIRTFIPSDSLPLELHDRLSTDFPKWEIDNKNSETDSDSYSRWEKLYGSKDCLRRSDLMLAFNPDVTPYRRETPRVRRIEARIRLEADTMDEDDDDFQLTPASRRLWIWLCTFKGQEGENDTYVDSVMRVVEPLTIQSVRRLAMVQSNDGVPIVDAASYECSTVIMDRLRTVSDSDVPVPIARITSNFGSVKKSQLLKKWEEEMAESLFLQGRGHVAVLCRTVFHITEERFPTSFVFLPYKLLKDQEGRLGLESPEAASIAMKFADCLLQLTDPKKILHFLEKKAIRFLGQGLGTEDDRTWYETDAAIKEQVEKLLSLYESGPAYFYFLDELTGMPVVPGRSGVYPFMVKEPLEMIRKILPLMLTGMVLMRGEKALSVIANIILSKKVSVVQTNWIKAAKDIVGYIHSPQTEWTSTFVQDLLPLKNGLIDLIDRGASENAPRREDESLSSEWVVELSLVRMVVEMHDPSRSFAGLRPKRGKRNVLWTRDSSFLDATDHLYRYDFNSARDLKDEESSSSDENEDTSYDNDSDREGQSDSDTSRSSTDVEDDQKDASRPFDPYEHLFGDLALVIQKSASDDGSEESGLRHTWSGFMEPSTGYAPFVPKRHRYATEEEPISLLTFDDSLGLDDVLQLRIQLDEQEAKLEFLKDKIENIQESELELFYKEEALGARLDRINNGIGLNHGPNVQGLTEARKLLIRISELEERVLCREIEMQQLKMDVSVFELEASDDSVHEETFTVADSISSANFS